MDNILVVFLNLRSAIKRYDMTMEVKPILTEHFS